MAAGGGQEQPAAAVAAGMQQEMVPSEASSGPGTTVVLHMVWQQYRADRQWQVKQVVISGTAPAETT